MEKEPYIIQLIMVKNTVVKWLAPHCIPLVIVSFFFSILRISIINHLIIPIIYNVLLLYCLHVLLYWLSTILCSKHIDEGSYLSLLNFIELNSIVHSVIINNIYIDIDIEMSKGGEGRLTT